MNWKFFIPFYGIYAVYKSNPPVGKIWYFWTFLISFVALSMMSGKDTNVNQNTGTSSNGSQESGKTEEIIAELPKVGTPVQTEYFEVLVKSYTVSPAVYTGNQFADLKREEGNKYLIIDVTFKNISDESRNIINEGSIFLKIGEKEYEYDKSEVILHSGYGVIMDQINPMVKKSTKLVYKVPEEFKGRIFWQPPDPIKESIWAK